MRDDRSYQCPTPRGATPLPYLLYLSRNDDPLMLEHANELALPEGCHFMEWDARAPDREALVAELVRRECLGAGPGGGRWTVRTYPTAPTAVVRTADAAQVLLHQSVGGMPSGEVERLTWVLVLPELGLPVDECTSVTDLGPYDGPMPP